MPGSDWLPVALVGLAILAFGFVLWGYRNQPTCAETLKGLHEDYARHEHQNYENNVTCERDCQVTFGLVSDADNPSDQGDKKQNADCDTPAELDLVAQSVMAHWAGISAILAMLGVFGLLWTLWETRRIGQAQVRAYLNVSGGEVTLDESDMEHIAFVVELHNSGQSPARNITIEGTTIFDYKSGDYRVIEYPEPAPELTINEIGGGENRPKPAKMDTPDYIVFDYMRIMDGEFGFFGDITYYDVFGEKFEVPFALSGALDPDIEIKPGVYKGRLSPCRADRWDDYRPEKKSE